MHYCSYSCLFPYFHLKNYYMLWNMYCYILDCLYPICKSLVSGVSRIICLICTLFYFYSYNMRRTQITNIY